MERGSIAWYSMNLGHGFILPEAGGPNVFVRRENIGVSGEEGPEAKNVSKV